jgi:hypothetical protein
MTDRERLPNRRTNRTYQFEHGGRRYYGTVGFYRGWRPGEVFLDAGKPGTDINAMAHAGAVFLSLALQYGCPLKVALDALPTHKDGTSADPFGAMLKIIDEEFGAGA